MVCGSTLVITNNLSLLAQSSQKAQLASHQESAGISQAAAPTASPEAKSADRVQAATLVVASTESKSAEKVMLISPAEQEQIEAMLATLSTNDKGDYSQLIKDFQSQHALSPTGEMDTSTLNEIMRQVALLKTNEALS